MQSWDPLEMASIASENAEIVLQGSGSDEHVGDIQRHASKFEFGVELSRS